MLQKTVEDSLDSENNHITEVKRRLGITVDIFWRVTKWKLNFFKHV